MNKLMIVATLVVAVARVPKEVVVNLDQESGIVSRLSRHSVDETIRKLQGVLSQKGITVFAIVDHSGEAEKAGLHMRPTKLLIFGNPKAGTPLMIAAPTLALDLPLKILVAQDGDGKVWVSYNSVEYLQARHRFPEELMSNLAAVETLAQIASE